MSTYKEYNAETGEYIEREFTGEEIQELLDTLPVIPVEQKTKLYKSTFVSRCTEEELQALRDHLETENIKFQEMYAACDYFLSNDTLFAVLYWTVSNLLTPARADELLEMEE